MAVKIPQSRIASYRPGTIIITSKNDVYFIAAALSDEDDDVFLSARKYADQGKAQDFAESWFFKNA